MKEIQLANGGVSLVDDEDYEWLSQWSWSRRKYANAHTTYVGRAEYHDGKKIIILMHRQILNAPSGKVVDHRNHDGLDNRKENLRLCLSAQNMLNRAKYTTKGHPIFKGVWWIPEMKKWRVRIGVNRRPIHIGYFDDDIDAARAYNEAAKKYHGEFAYLNEV